MNTGSSAPLSNISITTTFNSFSTERRYAADLSVGQLKRLLEGITGASPATMQLQLFNKDGSSLGSLSSDEVLLASAGVQNGMTIQVSDPSVRIGEFEDVSKVKKFELSEEEYASRSESLRAFKQKNKMGQFGELDEEEKAKETAKRESEAKKRLEGMEVGNRCLVTVQGQPQKRGTVMYKGTTNFKPGFWVGVKYDEPLGKHDGSVDGERYFECGPKYGAFVKPENVVVGDYPEENFMEEM